ncbi:MAG: hypothetical protein AABW47_02480 [Nanoarchaeota archaeon]
MINRLKKDKRNKNRKFFQHNFFPKNRRGFKIIGEETVETLFAVLGILILIGVFVAIYFSMYGKSTEIKKAEAILNGPQGIVTQIKAGTFPINKDIPNPVGWYLLGFTENKPNLCLGEKCLCVCEWAGDLFTPFKIDSLAQMNKCDKSGRCAVVSNLKNTFGMKIETTKLNTILIEQVNEELELTKKEA